MTDQLEKLVAETPQENVRSPKPKIEDFTDYGEDGKRVVNVAGYQECLKDWLEQEKKSSIALTMSKHILKRLERLKNYSLNTVTYFKHT